MIKKGNDLTIVSCGYDVVQSLMVAKIFEKYQISIEVMNFFCITPDNYIIFIIQLRKLKNL